MNPRALAQFFDAKTATEQPLVLASVIDTGGSTYSKPGDYMLIDAQGNFCGMLSGGCLEGDLVERAQQVFASGESELAEYDLSPDDELWGLGVGCEGTLRIFLQRVSVENDYQPCRKIQSVVVGDASKWVRLSDQFEVPIQCSPHLLILGAGGDVEAVLTMTQELGWRITISDHRLAYTQRLAADATLTIHCVPAAELCTTVDLERVELALIMSHHLVSDRHYLAQLADSEIGYVGLLGPAKRRDRLLQELGSKAASLKDRLRAPVGFDLGGRGPGAIAISIVAEMQRFLSDQGSGLPAHRR